MAAATCQSLALYATFREETGNGVNDPYQEPGLSIKSSRHGGKQFAVPFAKPLHSGPQGQEDLLGKPFSYECEPYLDPHEVQRQAMPKPKGPSLHTKPFTPAGTTAGKYGCIGQVLLDVDPPARPKTAPVESRKKIYTSPPKCGGFGQPLQDRTLGPVEEYMPDEYERGRILEKQLRKDARSKIPKAFVSSSNNGDKLFGTITLYSTSQSASDKDKAKRPSTAPVWRPSSPSRKGSWYGTISRGHAYIPNPVHQAQFRARSNESSAKPFKPSGGSRQRLSMWTVNPYERPARPPRDVDYTLL